MYADGNDNSAAIQKEIMKFINASQEPEMEEKEAGGTSAAGSWPCQSTRA